MPIEGPKSFVPPPSHAVVGTTLEQHIISGMRGASGATGEFHVAPQSDLARGPRHRFAGARGGPSRICSATRETSTSRARAFRSSTSSRTRPSAPCSPAAGHCAMLAERRDRQRRADRESRQVHRAVRPARRLEQHRRQHLDRNDLRHPAEASDRRGRDRRGCPSPGQRDGRRRLCRVRLVDHAGPDDGARRPLLHPRPVHRRVFPLARGHQVPAARHDLLGPTTATSAAGRRR